jgi:hypothetical protein
MFELPDLLRKDDPELLRPAWQKICQDEFIGPDADALRSKMAELAYGRAIREGFDGMLQRVRNLNRNSRTELGEATGFHAVQVTPDEFNSWVGETCMVRLAKFMEDARNNGPHAWSPDRGLGPVSYLLNGIALDLRKLIQARKRDRAREQNEEDLDDVEDRGRALNGLEAFDRLLARIVSENALRSAPDDVRKAFYLVAAGHRDEDSADQIGVTVQKLRRDRYRFQQRIGKNRGGTNERRG